MLEACMDEPLTETGQLEEVLFLKFEVRKAVHPLYGDYTQLPLEVFARVDKLLSLCYSEQLTL